MVRVHLPKLLFRKGYARVYLQSTHCQSVVSTFQKPQLESLCVFLDLLDQCTELRLSVRGHHEDGTQLVLTELLCVDLWRFVSGDHVVSLCVCVYVGTK
jgi:hypothetical protein